MPKKSMRKEEEKDASVYAQVATSLGPSATVLVASIVSFAYAVAHGGNAYVCLAAIVCVVGPLLYLAGQKRGDGH